MNGNSIYQLSKTIRFQIAKIIPDQLAMKIAANTNVTEQNPLRVYLCNIAVTHLVANMRKESRFDTIWNRLYFRAQQNRQFCRITKCAYLYEFWNEAFSREIRDLCLSALCCGYLPIVDVKNSEEENIWEWFHQQPFLDVEKAAQQFTQDELQQIPEWNRAYGNDIDFKNFIKVHSIPAFMRSYRKLYGKLFRLNHATERYVELDGRNALGPCKNALGVVARGTDYVKLRPKGHAVQPSIDQLIKKTAEWMGHGYEAIYLVTEDGKIADQFKTAFPGKVLENSRSYYDKAYDEKGLSYIGEVHFDRADDNRKKSQEYLSSLIILSKCSALIAGCCGASIFSDFIRPVEWNEKCFFDLGKY